MVLKHMFMAYGKERLKASAYGYTIPIIYYTRYLNFGGHIYCMDYILHKTLGYFILVISFGVACYHMVEPYTIGV